jgi:hypothetical protein
MDQSRLCVADRMICVSVDEWVPIAEMDPEGDETLPGVLIVRLSDSLTFCALSPHI